MEAKLSFLGAAGNVTGSRYLLDVDGHRVLVDCGLYQERQFRERNWEAFPVPPSSIDAVLLTHAHLDHCGLLPKLVRDGFRGRIHCTAATAELARIVLLDSARLQEEDAEFKARRHRREGRKGPYPEVPLYTAADAEACDARFRAVDYEQPVELGKGLTATFCNAGHILGSAIIRVDVRRNGETRSILFSGDVGRENMPIIRDPKRPISADYVLVESTYGDREHKTRKDVQDVLADVIEQTHQRGGNVVIPSFALERAQDLLYHLNELLSADRIPHLVAFLDSPMAIEVTEVFKKHPELYDRQMNAQVRRQSPFGFPGLRMTRTVDESKVINHIKGTAIIIAGSGMCTGGRIKHHLVNNISRPESTILFVGYQAVGTLGRTILDTASGAGAGEKAREVRILGQMRPMRASIERIHGFSGHADRKELLAWLGGLPRPPRKVFVVHGEPESSGAFAGFLRDNTGWDVSVPQYGEEALLD